MKPFLHAFRVPFHELDPGGVLFHAHLFVHAHEAYEMLLREIGFGLSRLLKEGKLAIPLVRATADYRHPMHLDERIEIELQVREIGRTSFGLEYRFLRDAKCCATAATTHVVINRCSGQPVPLPAGLVSGLKGYLSEGA